jgi:hypothetical protein
MRVKSAALQGGLAAVALIAAYATWQKKPEQTEENVVVLDATRAELESVRYEDAARWVEVFRGKDGGQDAALLRYGQRASAPEEPKEPTSKPPSLPAVPDREVKANDNAERLLEKFSPMRAARALGKLGDDKLKELGLADTPRKLEVKVRGRTHAFTISQAGQGAPYLRNVQDGRVYLAQSALVSDLDSAQARLAERRPHTFKLAEVDGLTVSASGKQRSLSQTVTEQGVLQKVSPAATPDKPDDFAKNWLEKVWRIFPTELLGKGEEPPSGAPEVQAKVEYLSKGKSKGFIELARSGNDTFVRTENMLGWAKATVPEGLLAEAARVASGQ